MPGQGRTGPCVYLPILYSARLPKPRRCFAKAPARTVRLIRNLFRAQRRTINSHGELYGTV